MIVWTKTSLFYFKMCFERRSKMIKLKLLWKEAGWSNNWGLFHNFLVINWSFWALWVSIFTCVEQSRQTEYTYCKCSIVISFFLFPRHPGTDCLILNIPNIKVALLQRKRWSNETLVPTKKIWFSEKPRRWRHRRSITLDTRPRGYF